MTFLRVFVISTFIYLFNSDYDVCNYGCNYATLDKPCKSLVEKDRKCVNYNKGSVCPDGYKDCSKDPDPCSKGCDPKTPYKPCISVDLYDSTCYDYIQGIGCPDNTKDCGGIHIPCEYCVKDRPCLDNGYIYGKYECYEQSWIDKNGRGPCPEGTTYCTIKDDVDPCEKECSSETYGKPCMHLNFGDDTCFNYMTQGGCPSGTKDCSDKPVNPCDRCTYKNPCLHDNKDDNSCLPKNKDGQCSLGSTLCDKYSTYKSYYNYDKKWKNEPTNRPTQRPQGDVPYQKRPTWKPTRRPTEPKPPTPLEPILTTQPPTGNPTNNPTEQPTKNPTEQPTKNPTEQPTKNPTQQPTENPTEQPTKNPIKIEEPTWYPSKSPTKRSIWYKPTKTPVKKYEKKCYLCSEMEPCISDSWIYGYYECFSKKYSDENGELDCPKGTSLCKMYDKTVCTCNSDKPCIHLNIDDNTCHFYMQKGGCPPGTFDCNIIENSCDYCPPWAPCLHDNYGDDSCKPTNDYGECYPGTTQCYINKDNNNQDICSKPCKKGSGPCMNDYYTCYDQYWDGTCPWGTKLCYIKIKNDDTDICSQKCQKGSGPCMSNDGTCYPTFGDGTCQWGTTKCGNKYSSLKNIQTELQNILNTKTFNDEKMISIELLVSGLVFVIGSVILLSILHIIYKCKTKKNFKTKDKVVFESVSNKDDDDDDKNNDNNDPNL